MSIATAKLSKTEVIKVYSQTAPFMIFGDV